MGTKILILLTMIFLHVIADYNLQGWLASAKQKSWWEENAPQDMYKYDYLAALFMHSFSWTFMIMLPLIVYSSLTNGMIYPMLILINTLIHMYVDDLKANKRKINLVQDQSLHMIQIFVTWLCYFFIYK